ncbi:MAG: copper chaperone PCu(A)C [Gammaproteobacteria bacterium]|nr:copper chaperone PCu(A)C [Gammaproteobacteria bacterium]MCH9744978.1 copper chaperone PCu(A)C [Gammaproteobacteria bacterium]
MKSYRLLRNILAIAIVAFMSTAMATPEIASNVIFVKIPRINIHATRDHAAAVSMEIKNTGRKTYRLIAAFSPVAEQVQLHLTQHHAHKRMRQIDDILIKPHSEKDLKRNGPHIMLIGLKEKLKKDQNIPIALIFNDGSWTTLFAKVI